MKPRDLFVLVRDRKDLQGHLLLGALVTVYFALTWWALQRGLHPGLALAVTGWLFGWGLERYQAIRREGTPALDDLIASAAVPTVAGLAWFAVDILVP